MCKFTKSFDVFYEGVDPKLYIKFTKLMSLMQETSIAHTDSTNRPMSWYVDNNFGFLLTNWDVRVNKYPFLYEKIRISTWPVMFKGILAYRGFDAYDSKNDLIAAANTKWVFTDLSRHRPIKVPADVVTGYGELSPPLFESDYKFPEITQDYESASRRSMQVTRRDIDSNNHVNNIKYIEWVVDDIPQNLYDNYCVKQMKCVYKKECKVNQEVMIETYVKDNEVITSVNDTETGAAHAWFYTMWG